jgi:hypothetical protein
VDYEKDVTVHCREIEKCNQRGGRMLSVVDLIKAGTLSLSEAAFLMHRIFSGNSFIVGANPGGAGKTTVMCALLNFLPAGIPIIHTEDTSTLEKSEKKSPCCFLCHEIGPGNYYSYLWGKGLKKFFQLNNSLHTLVSNIHAESYGEVKYQVCTQNLIPEENLKHIDLFIFMKIQRNNFKIQRQISEILCRENSRYIPFEDRKIENSAAADREKVIENRRFLKLAVRDNICLMENFRKAVLEFLY